MGYSFLQVDPQLLERQPQQLSSPGFDREACQSGLRNVSNSASGSYRPQMSKSPEDLFRLLNAAAETLKAGISREENAARLGEPRGIQALAGEQIVGLADPAGRYQIWRVFSSQGDLRQMVVRMPGKPDATLTRNEGGSVSVSSAETPGAPAQTSAILCELTAFEQSLDTNPFSGFAP